jgi:hypothetical protein
MWLAEPLQQRYTPEVPVQLADPLPRQTLGMAQILPALQFSQAASPVYHALDKQILLPRAPAKQPLSTEPFRWN